MLNESAVAANQKAVIGISGGVFDVAKLFGLDSAAKTDLSLMAFSDTY